MVPYQQDEESHLLEAFAEVKERVPPQNLQAEQYVLGCLMMDKEAIPKVVELLRPESFYRDAHRQIYEAILTLFEKGEPADSITVAEILRSQNRLEAVGGAIYLTDLLSSIPTSANVEYYAKIIEEKFVLRRLIEVGTKIVGEAFTERQEVDLILDAAEQMIFDVALKRVRQGFFRIDGVLKQVLDRIDELYGKKEHITGVPTGFADLDNMTAGLQHSDLIILAARPSVGKTAFALNIAANVAVRSQIPVAIFSLEMARDQLAQRLLCSEAEIDSQKLKTANLPEVGWKRLTRALSRLTEAPIFIDDTAAQTSVEVRAKARRLRAERGLGLVVIDYLQLMQGRSRTENRNQEISEICRSLKTLARELEVPVIALSQLSRAVELRHDRLPRLSDLRESGEIEQTADLVCFIHREDYYNPSTEKGNLAEIIVAKHRNGPVGSVELVFRKEIAKFHSKETHLVPA